MDVNIYTATLTIQGVRQRLTKAVAKQFPIVHKGIRWDAAIKGLEQPNPLCKVNGRTLGENDEWLYLVTDKVAGLVWIPPAVFNQDYIATVLGRGGWVDNPEHVPTVIL